MKQTIYSWKFLGQIFISSNKDRINTSIKNLIDQFYLQFGGNPVSCAIGIAVFDVMQNEQLMSSAKFVGRTLLEGFRNILDRHPMMGDIRFVLNYIGIGRSARLGGHDTSCAAACRRQYVNWYIILYFYGVQGTKPPEGIRF